jgi:hypothetical protein
MYLTRGGSVHMPWTSGPRGGGPPGSHLQPLTNRLHGDTLQEAVTGNPKLKVYGGRTPWQPGHVAMSAGHHMVSYQLNQVGNPTLDPYKYPPPTGGNQHTTLYL